ncbi:hypothetical protein KIPB_006108 [Kipferlia bialata]|uniref:Uncharacterized protein n=1 Tax=Kipferlia bialata TaxID=797122 RepID=A0A9K3CWR3_9EUKA|nr:hypothetical protein KIPB_006108 [Kipferlia bialata]|eukprot:g6108.t1
MGTAYTIPEKTVTNEWVHLYLLYIFVGTYTLILMYHWLGAAILRLVWHTYKIGKGTDRERDSQRAPSANSPPVALQDRKADGTESQRLVARTVSGGPGDVLTHTYPTYTDADPVPEPDDTEPLDGVESDTICTVVETVIPTDTVDDSVVSRKRGRALYMIVAGLIAQNALPILLADYSLLWYLKAPESCR